MDRRITWGWVTLSLRVTEMKRTLLWLCLLEVYPMVTIAQAINFFEESALGISLVQISLENGKTDVRQAPRSANIRLPLSASEIVWSNIDSIFAFKGSRTDTLYLGRNAMILGMAAARQACYFSEQTEDLQLTDCAHLRKVDLQKKKVSTVMLPSSLGFYNLSVSPNGQYLSFCQELPKRAHGNVKCRLLIFNVASRKLEVADSGNGGSFGSSELNGTVASWDESGRLLYTRLVGENMNRWIYSYDIKARRRKQILEFPARCNRYGFAYRSGMYFFIQDLTAVVSLDLTGNKKTWYVAREGYKIGPELFAQ
jgi:hypothetical protein